MELGALRVPTGLHIIAKRCGLEFAHVLASVRREPRVMRRIYGFPTSLHVTTLTRSKLHLCPARACCRPRANDILVSATCQYAVQLRMLRAGGAMKAAGRRKAERA